MTGNRVSSFRVHDTDTRSFAGKGIQDNGDKFECELISASLSRLMSSQLHYLREH